MALVQVQQDWDLDRPALRGRGPVEFSTDTDLTLASDQTCWDVNGYYRDLGIPFPFIHASRADLRRSYLELDGPNDPRKTFVFKQLLNRETKQRYDRWPMGSVPFWDKYVESQIKTQAMEEMRRRGMGQDDMDYLIEVFADLGVELDDSPEGVDTEIEIHHDHSEASASAQFPFSFYLWRTHFCDLGRLAQWQELFVRACGSQRIKTRLAFGYVGDTHLRWVVRDVGYRRVVFFNHDIEPDSQIVQEIISSILTTYLP